MARLIDVADPSRCSAALALKAGDILMLEASGAHVRTEDEAGVVDLLGAFVPAVVGNNGAVVTPMAAPNVVVCRASRPGRASLDVMTGDPYFKRTTVTLHLVVEP